MEYLAPTSKDNPISFALPQINNALDASQTAGSILTAVNEWINTLFHEKLLSYNDETAKKSIYPKINK